MQLALDGRPIDELAIDVIRDYAPKDEPYCLAYSGGKDSTVLLDLAERAGVNFIARNQWIPIEPPELRAFVRDVAKTKPIIIERPKRRLIDVAIEKKLLPMRNRRWCCDVLKESVPAEKCVLTGIRASESSNRAKRRMVESCTKLHAFFVHPIFDWNNSDVWQYIRERNLPYCSLYDEGFKRLGCVLCPMTRNIEQQKQRWPGQVRVWRRIADAVYAVQQNSPHKTADDNWNFWLKRDSHARTEEEDSCPLFAGMMDYNETNEHEVTQ